ncbi:hypothetical protein ABW20_dc0106354 [Dactylellina cionopaga]|nr:hypothetical protein ABW20_dc0106354 [Dactylellina cionopaga]
MARHSYSMESYKHDSNTKSNNGITNSPESICSSYTENQNYNPKSPARTVPLNMEAPINFDQIQFGNDIFNSYPFSDLTMSTNDWLSAISPEIDSALGFTYDETTFTQTQTGLQQTERAPASPAATAKISSSKRSTKRSHTRTETSMLFLNEKTGLLSPNLTRFTPSTTQSPAVGPTMASPGARAPGSNTPRSQSPTPRDLQQQESRPETASTDSSHPQPYVCNHCKAAFRFSRDYWQHKAQVHNDFQFYCQLGCGKGFARRDNLVQHHRQSKRHRRSPLPPVFDDEEPSRRKKLRMSSSSVAGDLEELRYTSPRASFNSSSSSSHMDSDTASSSTPRDADGDVLSHPDYLRLQREFELLNARYEMIKKEVHTLREEKEEWQAKDYLRRHTGRGGRSDL